MNTKGNENPGKQLLGFFLYYKPSSRCPDGEYFFYKDGIPPIYLPSVVAYRSTEKIGSQREKIIAENL